jgi:hypothetical protein
MGGWRTACLRTLTVSRLYFVHNKIIDGYGGVGGVKIAVVILPTSEGTLPVQVSNRAPWCQVGE